MYVHSRMHKYTFTRAAHGQEQAVVAMGGKEGEGRIWRMSVTFWGGFFFFPYFSRVRGALV